jgi:hypothetical protein
MSRPASKIPVIRRSFALPGQLVKQAQACVAPEQRDNLNGLLKMALESFVKQHRYEDFKRSMQALARDPKAVAELRRMSKDFASTDEDGLK